MTDLLMRVPAEVALPPAPEGDRAEPATLFGGTTAESLMLAVAPSMGRFRPVQDLARRLAAGTVIGHITGGNGRADEVRTPVDAHLCALLVRPRQLVAPGQALAWLQRDLAAAAAPAR